MGGSLSIGDIWTLTHKTKEGAENLPGALGPEVQEEGTERAKAQRLDRRRSHSTGRQV